MARGRDSVPSSPSGCILQFFTFWEIFDTFYFPREAVNGMDPVMSAGMSDAWQYAVYYGKQATARVSFCFSHFRCGRAVLVNPTTHSSSMLYHLPFGTTFNYDESTQALTLAALSGLTCGHNGLADDDTCSGLAVLGVGPRRLEGGKLKYQCSQPSEEEFVFTAVDEERVIRLECRWRFERPYGVISCRSVLT